MKQLRNIFFIIIVTFSFLLAGNDVMARGDNPGCDPGESFEACCARLASIGSTSAYEAMGCPVDSWVYVLLAAGVGLGIKRTRETKAKPKKV